MSERTIIVWSSATAFQMLEKFAESEEDFLQGILGCFCHQGVRQKCEAKFDCEYFIPGLWDKETTEQVFAACKKHELTIAVKLFCSIPQIGIDNLKKA